MTNAGSKWPPVTVHHQTKKITVSHVPNVNSTYGCPTLSPTAPNQHNQSNKFFIFFIYGINIPRCPYYTHETIRQRLASPASNIFRLVGMTNRPDTLLIHAVTASSAAEAAEW